MHEPEVMLIRAYCGACDITILFRAVVYPGGRESEPALCPTCKRDLGEWVETETTTVMNQMRGDVGEQIYQFAEGNSSE